MKTRCLLLIDPQNDFTNPDGSLYIPGAEDGIKNIIELINSKGSEIDGIIITQDTHRSYHIGHPGFWEEYPSPFTTITESDVLSGRYNPINKLDRDDAISYIKQVGKHKIWPEHCILGTWGWCFPSNLIESINLWDLKSKGDSRYVISQKGLCPTRDSFSTFGDPDCYRVVSKYLLSFDEIVIAGFAKDICVAATVKDMIATNKYDGRLVFFEPGLCGLDDRSPELKIYEEAINKHGARVIN